jgi:RHS repeat-associated protein
LTEINCISYFRSWLLGDHLGSTSMVADDDGDVVSEVRYSAFGEIRYDSGTMTTDYLYTGQREEAEVGLYYYVARWYDPAIGRFIQADSVVPNPGSAKGFDRYAYSWNNPMKYTDPTGHVPILLDGEQFVETDPMQGITNHFSTTYRPNANNANNWKPLSEADKHAPSPFPDNNHEEGGSDLLEGTHSSNSEGPSREEHDEAAPANRNSTCYPASIAGSLLLLPLAIMDYAMVVVTIETASMPVVEVFVVVPIDFLVLDLHPAVAGLIYQGTQKPCNEINFEFLPPWGFEE